MDIKTQRYLQSLSIEQSSKAQGLTLNKLKRLDTDQNGQISESETAHKISTADLDQINQRLKAAEQMQKILPKSLPFVALEELPVYSRAELNSQLFPGGLEGINPNDIQQGNIGDCFFLSTLTCLAKNSPEKIINMIDDLGGDRYKVTFPGAKYPVTVSLPAEEWQSKTGRDHNNQANGSTWVQVLEKAFVNYALQENTGTLNARVDNTLGAAKDTFLGLLSPGALLAKKVWGQPDAPQTDPRAHFSNGGLHSDAIKILTGQSTDDDILSLTRNSTTRSKLQEHLSTGSVILASTVMAGSDEHNISDSHVYAVLGFDQSSDTLLIRNPHGSDSDATGLKYSDSQNDGIYKITLNEFNRYFNLISYQE